jgi:hypothetical protein
MTPQWVRDRIASATKVPQDHLEPTKLTRYDNGEFFHKHTDASFLNEKMFAFAAKLADVDEEGVQDPCSWPSRFCTLFLYLNVSLPRELSFEEALACRPLSPQLRARGSARYQFCTRCSCCLLRVSR